MSVKKIGKIDWSEGDVGGSDFLNLEEGSNVVRCVSSPVQFYICWTEDATGQKRKFKTALKDCPLVQRGEKPQARWYVAVLNRKTGQPGILEIGPQIFKQVLALSKKPKWGNPRDYDVDIVRQPKGSQPLYVVSPEPKEPLTDAEKVLVKEFLAKVDLVKMTEAPSPEEVLEKLGEVASTPKASAKSEKNVVATASTTDDSDDDFNFNDE
jgi:hypothetical protein